MQGEGVKGIVGDKAIIQFGIYFLNIRGIAGEV
jgi:hypothetical protein